MDSGEKWEDPIAKAKNAKSEVADAAAGGDKPVADANAAALTALGKPGAPVATAAPAADSKTLSDLVSARVTVSSDRDDESNFDTSAISGKTDEKLTEAQKLL